MNLVAQALYELMQKQYRPGIYGYVVSEDGHLISANMRAGGYYDLLVVVWNGKAKARLTRQLTTEEMRRVHTGNTYRFDG